MVSKQTKGIILAGGTGTRLYPVTRAVCKQLLPVYNKPMIYYPLSQLILAGIKDILIISAPEYLPSFKKLIGDGSRFGVKITYQEQKKPKGIAEAFILGKSFIGKSNVCLILGDNIFFGHGLPDVLKKNIASLGGAVIFGYRVDDPQRYGVVEFNKKGEVTSIKEKPRKPKSNYAVCGLYLYDNNVIKVAQRLKPSVRGELEITDVNSWYLGKKQLRVELLGRGYAWLDTGTCDSLLDASSYIATIERRQGLKVGSPEEAALHMGYISKAKFKTMAREEEEGSYGQYLRKIEEDNGI